MEKFLTTLISVFSGAGLLVILVFCTNFLPDSPFQSFTSGVGVFTSLASYSSVLNWFLPISEVIAVLEGWIACVSFYFLWRFIYNQVTKMSSGGSSLDTILSK